MDHNMEHLQVDQLEVTTSESWTNGSEYNSTEVTYSYHDPLLIRICLETFFVLSLICIAADILIIYVTLKYRRLRQNESNVIILNWCIINAIFLFLSPMSFRLMIDFEFGMAMYRTMCLIEELSYSLFLSDILFIILLTMYWYYTRHDPLKIEKLRRNILFFIIMIYCILLFLMGYHGYSCLSNSYFVGMASLVMVVGFLIFVVFTIVINIVSFIRQRLSRNNLTDRKTKLNFIITNTFFLSYVPTLASMIFVPIFRVHYMIIFFLMFIGLANPIYNFILLYTLDNDYRTYIQHTFKCSCKEYSKELIEDPIVFNGQEVTSNIENREDGVNHF